MVLVTHCVRCGTVLSPGEEDLLCTNCRQKQQQTVVTELKNDPQTSNPNEAESDFESPSISSIASFFPDLEIIQLVSRGALSLIYKAKQKSLNRFVTLKLLAPEISANPAIVECFTLETQTIARLSHPQIVAVFDFGQRSQMLFQLTEFVDGQILSELLTSGCIGVPDALNIVSQICDGLQYAHDHGVIHRHVTPENILIDRQGRIKITDFGMLTDISGLRGQHKLFDSNDARDETDALPSGSDHSDATIFRQPAAQDTHVQTDIQAVGRVFYQLLTGRVPNDVTEFLPRTANLDVRLSGIVSRAMEKEPSRQFHCVSEIRTEIDKIVATSIYTNSVAPLTMPAVSSNVPIDPPTPKRVNWSWWGFAPILILLTLSIAVFSSWYRSAKVGNRPQPREIQVETVDKDAVPTGPVATLPNGMTVELSALAEYPPQENQWWAPSGSPLLNARYKFEGNLAIHTNGKIVRSAIFRLQPRSVEPMTFDLFGTTSISKILARPRNTDTIELRGATMEFPESQKLATFRLGLGLDKWETVGRSFVINDGLSSLDPSLKIQFKVISESTEGVRISATCPPADNEMRLVAIDQQNKMIQPKSWTDSGNSDLRILKARFLDPNLKQIKCFEIQKRPLYMIQFRDIALQSGIASKPTATYLGVRP